MAIEVFNRHEYKYILSDGEFEKMTELLEEHMTLDSYNKDGKPYTISNIYYDTEDDEFIRRSVSRPAYKEKLRLRAYGVPESGDKVFLEIKKKYRGIVNKRRTVLELDEAYRFIENGNIGEIKDYMNRQVIHELEYMFSTNALVPKVYIAYDRIAYFGKEDNNLRISFDTNIRTRRHDLRLENGGETQPLLQKNCWVMEIKDRWSMPVWLAHILSESGIVKRSFSKYGTEYKNYVREGMNDARLSV